MLAAEIKCIRKIAGKTKYFKEIIQTALMALTYSQNIPKKIDNKVDSKRHDWIGKLETT